MLHKFTMLENPGPSSSEEKGFLAWDLESFIQRKCYFHLVQQACIAKKLLYRASKTNFHDEDGRTALIEPTPVMLQPSMSIPTGGRCLSVAMATIALIILFSGPHVWAALLPKRTFKSHNSACDGLKEVLKRSTGYCGCVINYITSSVTGRELRFQPYEREVTE